MDISKVIGGTWFEAEAQDEKIGMIRLKLKSISSGAAIKNKELIEKDELSVFNIIADLIVDWDFTDGDKKFICSPENKLNLIPHLLGLKLKNPDAPELTKILIEEIIAFSANINNFLKN